MKKILPAILALLLGAFTAGAQTSSTTKVRGTVTDADTGEPIPFAGIYFKDTTIGLTADIDGKYILETRDPAAKILVCQLLGYDTQEKPVKVGAFTEVNFKLKLTNNELSGSFVKADNKKIKRLLANIEANRERNDPDLRPWFTCNIYNKMELDISHAREQLDNPIFNKQLGFVFDYMDTSAVSGVPYLPAMLSETLLERRHRAKPELDNETILANRVSGINPDHNLLTQFTGSMHLKANFYRPFINCFNVEFPSPAQKNGLLYYNYFIVDSLQMDGRKTYVVRYHPKPLVSSPVLDGEMRIDAEEFAIKSVKAKMQRGGNVNWLRDIVLEEEFQRLQDSTWFFSSDKLYADFSIALGDSTKMMSVLGNRLLSYSNPDFSPIEDMHEEEGKVKVLEDSNHKDEAFWEQARPVELTDGEKGIYRMVNDVQQTTWYKVGFKIAYSFAQDYFDIGKIGFGPLGSMYSYNSLEGARPKFGIHTSKELSTDFQIKAYAAYGFLDKKWKGKLSYEHMLKRDPQRKITAELSHDVHQLGKGLSNLTVGNPLSSIWAKESKPVLQTMLEVRYDHEFSMQLNGVASMTLRRYYANPFVPMDRWDGTSFNSVATNELRLKLRFSKEETVNRGYYNKTYVHSEYPIVSLDLQGSIPGLRTIDADNPAIGFFMPQVHVDWKFRVPPIGMSDMHLRTGTIIGQVPWTLLNLFQANPTVMTDKSSFSCMQYFEFAADTWATLIWYHTFNGFFLGKIPLIRELQLREEFIAKVAYGTLRDKNNGSDPRFGAMTRFPSYGNVITRGMEKEPYIELGAGLSNIFRLLRVDFIWRVTQRHWTDPATGEVKLCDGAQPFWNMGNLFKKAPAWAPNAINIGMEIRF